MVKKAKNDKTSSTTQKQVAETIGQSVLTQPRHFTRSFHTESPKSIIFVDNI